MPYALCPMPYALCSMLCALCLLFGHDFSHGPDHLRSHGVGGIHSPLVEEEDPVIPFVVALRAPNDLLTLSCDELSGKPDSGSPPYSIIIVIIGDISREDQVCVR